MIIRSLLMLSCLLSAPLYAEDVNLKLPSGLTAFAKYEMGDDDKPAVLLLHGFLQTGAFPTIARLGDALFFEGYTVLLPNLSLGIDKRKNSLSCEAIQTHGMEDAAEEIGAWMDFLAEQGHQAVIGIGHSFGSLQLLAYQAQKHDKRLQRLILTSLVYVAQNMPKAQKALLMQRAEQAIADKRETPDVYRLSFCQKYTSLPDKFYTYLSWDDQRVIEALNAAKIPVNVIIAEQDARIDPAWLANVTDAVTTLDSIVGANHFFDAEYQDDLQARIIGLLP